jgi:large subunit ribosomal protein L24
VKIRKGDTVEILSGKDRKRRGQVSKVLPGANKVIVDRINVAKRHTKATRAIMQGGIIDKDMPFPISNVAIVCADCGPTRVGFLVIDGEKKRICRKCEKPL